MKMKTEPLGHIGISPKNKIYSFKGLKKDSERSQINDLMM